MLTRCEAFMAIPYRPPADVTTPVLHTEDPNAANGLRQRVLHFEGRRISSIPNRSQKAEAAETASARVRSAKSLGYLVLVASTSL